MYAPSEEGRFKVYIVDEAHMLTKEAWNALLKILEEPPPRVIFIFATTEPQKIQQIAAPILSRCQRFDFRRIGTSEIIERLRNILSLEDAHAAEGALEVIAKKADGGMRDALSLLDQVLSLTGGEVTQESVRRVLGLVEDERYLELLDLILEGARGDVFSFVEGLLTARQRSRRLGAPLGEDREELVNAVQVSANGFSIPTDERADAEVLAHCELLEELAALWNVGDSRPDDRLRRHPVDPGPLEHDRPAVWLPIQDPHHRVEQRTLPRAVVAEDHADGALLHGERDVAQGTERTVPGLDSGQLQKGCGRLIHRPGTP